MREDPFLSLFLYIAIVFNIDINVKGSDSFDLKLIFDYIILRLLALFVLLMMTMTLDLSDCCNELFQQSIYCLPIIILGTGIIYVLFVIVLLFGF